MALALRFSSESAAAVAARARRIAPATSRLGGIREDAARRARGCAARRGPRPTIPRRPAIVEGGDGLLALAVAGREELLERFVEGLVARRGRPRARRAPGTGGRSRPRPGGRRAAGCRSRGSSSPRRCRGRRAAPAPAPSRRRRGRSIAARIRCAQLGGGLVGEGEGQDRVGRDALVADEPAVAVDHHARSCRSRRRPRPGRRRRRRRSPPPARAVGTPLAHRSLLLVVARLLGGAVAAADRREVAVGGADAVAAQPAPSVRDRGGCRPPASARRSRRARRRASASSSSKSSAATESVRDQSVGGGRRLGVLEDDAARAPRSRCRAAGGRGRRPSPRPRARRRRSGRAAAAASPSPRASRAASPSPRACSRGRGARPSGARSTRSIAPCRRQPSISSAGRSRPPPSPNAGLEQPGLEGRRCRVAPPRRGSGRGGPRPAATIARSAGWLAESALGGDLGDELAAARDPAPSEPGRGRASPPGRSR